MAEPLSPAAPDIYDLIPKVELHCHVEGAIRPATVVELARKAGRPLPVDDPTELYRYRSLAEFRRVFALVQDTLATPDDWARVGYESLLDGVRHGLRHRELSFTPTRHLAAGQDLGAIVDGLTAGIEAAEAETGARCDLIASCDRTRDPAAGRELVERVGELRRAGRARRVVGVGIDGPEVGTDLRAWADAYALAARLGLRRTAHAAQDGGAENVAIALDVLGAERIDHGLAILDDPALTRCLAERRIPITSCPSSNVLILNRFPRLEDHPFRRMREAGLLATLNTDDPAMIGLDLGAEYRAVARALGLDLEALAAVALDGVEASWLDADEKRALRARFERELASLRARAGGAPG